MKRLMSLLLAALMVLSAASALAEGDVLLGQADCAAHGTGCFAVITVALQDDVILAAKIDEFQFISDREELQAVGVPNSDGSFGSN